MDVDCAAGGLSKALSEGLRIGEYVGCEISKAATSAGKLMGDLSSIVSFFCGDICGLELESGDSDLVVSLSCADWNIRTGNILKTCWPYVRQGGPFMLTLRLTPQSGCKDFQSSYQYIHFGDSLPENCGRMEKSSYVVFNTSRVSEIFCCLEPKPRSILARDTGEGLHILP